MKEALEANDWASNEDDFGIDDFGDLEDEESMGFGAEAAELEMEMFGMKRAIYGIGEEDEERAGEEGVGREEGGDEEDEVEKLEALMLRMQAVRGEFASSVGRVGYEFASLTGILDMGADLPEAERKRFAAKAVKDIMKTL